MLSERKWSGDSVVRLLAALFAIIFCAQVIWLLLDKLDLPLSDPDKTLLRMMLMTLSFQGAMLGLIAIFVHQEDLSWAEAFGFRSSNLAKTILLGLIGGIIIVPIAWELQQISITVLKSLTLEPQAQEIVTTFKKAAKATATPAIIRQHIFLGISVILIAPIAEEMFFRGILYPTIKKIARPSLALWSTALLFAIMHMNASGFVSFVALAVLLTLIYETTDNLLAPILTHSFFNTVNFIYLLNEESFNQFLKRFT